MSIKLRDYQQFEIINPLMEYLEEHEGNPVVASPTGTGKSLAINGFIKQCLEGFPEFRCMVVAHVKEVIGQNAASMVAFWPRAPVGIYSAGLKQYDTRSPIIYAGIQSIYKKAKEFGFIDALICDEAHTISPKETTMWQVFIAGLKDINPDIRVIGFTATPYRLGMGLITEGGLFDKIVVDLTETARINQFVAEGFLSPLISKKPSVEIDITNVSMKGGDFDEHELQLASDTDDLNKAVVKECLKHGRDRNHWLVFATGITHAEHLQTQFRAVGVLCEIIHGGMTAEQRTRLIGDKGEGIEGIFQKGEIRCLINVGILTTGFDFPALDMIVLARATQSTGLYVQILGRGTRPAPVTKKVNCIARGQRVLTDIGLVPIQDVTRKMKVWDGVDFVEHGGSICRGRKHVITYAGLTATKDHLVKTQQGWQTFWKSFIEQTPICVTGHSEQTVRETDSLFTRNSAQRKKFKGLSANTMCFMQNLLRKGLYFCYSRASGVPQMWKKAVSTAHTPLMAIQPLLRSVAPLHSRGRCRLSSLWRSWDKIPVQESFRNGRLDNAEFRIKKKTTTGSERQQRSLRSWKSTIFNSESKSITYPEKPKQSAVEPFSQEVSKNTLRRSNLVKVFQWWKVRLRNSREILPTVLQTKREVWDILNCGPRNSFTCEGLLVHNCLVLDFAGNIKRLGPFNAPVIPRPRRKGDAVAGEAPVKACPECDTYVHTRTTKCPECGYEFPPSSCIEGSASMEKVMVESSNIPQFETFVVTSTHYRDHLSRQGGVCARVTYGSLTHSFSDYYFPNSGNAFLRRRFEDFWFKAGGKLPPPDSVEGFLERAKNELKQPREVKVCINKKHPDVVDRIY